MGDLQSWPSKRNGTSIHATPSTSTPPSNPHQSWIGDDIWRRAEDAAGEIIRWFQPTIASEQKRNAVVEHLQWLIKASVGCEVFPFGSVPLKTYLPDGDIDLTALSYKTVDDALAKSVLSVLEREAQNKAAEFEIKDVRYIKAEVQLVKCVAQNIIVDISFNQLGGLCTLCFLEQVDCLIGKGHLFKRSVMLIKAWCYYESRILGAHHNLISTYALETMVLYIFNRFHLSLHGPFGVLYRFLDYFSKFDWDNYCLSINGLVSVASLPEIVVEALENDGDNLLLSKEFLRNCLDKFSVPSRGLDNTIPFSQKHLNIVDPLKENNNLGRSVNKGNFYRIRSAFTYGARMLGQILLLPGESILGELHQFFMNTLERHQSRPSPNVQGSFHCCRNVRLYSRRSDIVSSVPDVRNSTDNEDISCTSSKEEDLMAATGVPKATNHLSDLCSDYDSDFKNLLYGKWCHDHILCPVVSIPPLMTSQLHSKSSQNTLHQSTHLKPKVLQHLNGSGISPGLYLPPDSGYYLEDRPFTYSTSSVEEMLMLQGKGTYFPITNHHSYQLGKAKNRSQLRCNRLPRPHCNDCSFTTPDRSSLKLPCSPVSEVPDFCGNGKGKPSCLPEFIPTCHQNRRFPYSNGIEMSSVDRLKFGTIGTLRLGATTLEQQKQQDSGAEQQMQCSGSMFQMPAVPSAKEERTPPPYCLKDEDFPPLSVCSRKGGRYKDKRIKKQREQVTC